MNLITLFCVASMLLCTLEGDVTCAEVHCRSNVSKYYLLLQSAPSLTPWHWSSGPEHSLFSPTLCFVRHPFMFWLCTMTKSIFYRSWWTGEKQTHSIWNGSIWHNVGGGLPERLPVCQRDYTNTTKPMSNKSDGEVENAPSKEHLKNKAFFSSALVEGGNPLGHSSAAIYLFSFLPD